MQYYCYQVSEDEAREMWANMTSGLNLMNVYVPWCVNLQRRHNVESDMYIQATMHHWHEFIAFLTRMKLAGEYRESK
jgi:hypothetical protein